MGGSRILEIDKKGFMVRAESPKWILIGATIMVLGNRMVTTGRTDDEGRAYRYLRGLQGGRQTVVPCPTNRLKCALS